MNYSEIKSAFLKSFIGFLVLTAVIAIITVIGGEMGSTQARILGTTFTISIASICAMSCVAFLEKRTFKPAGIAGMVFSLISAILIISAIWADIHNEIYLKFTIAAGVSAFSFAHSLLLFLPKLDEDKEWVQSAAAVTITLLAIQIIMAVWFEIDDQVYYRIMTVIAIVVGLETLVIPILMRLGKGDESDIAREEKLILEKLDEEVYRDSSGNLYKVTPMKPVKGGENQQG